MKANSLFNITLFVCVLLLQSTTVSTKHIMLLPFFVTSHCLEMRSIGEELTKRGHKVTAYLADNFNSDVCLEGTDIGVMQYHIDPEIKRSLEEHITTLYFKEDWSFIEFFKIANNIQFMTCNETMIATKHLEQELKNQHFDIAIIDGVPFNKCYFFVPKFLSIPAITESAYIQQHYGNLPFQINAFPNALSTMSNAMSFTDRLINFFSQVAMKFVIDSVMSSIDTGSILGPSFANLDAEALYRNSELFLENSDFVVDYPKATFPNYVQTGPLTARKPRPLVRDLETFVSEASAGVIYVSFGSIIESVSKKIQNTLLDVFTHLKQRIVFKGNLKQELGNLKTVKWIAQNDILGHNKTILFISHCGKNSFLESVYHGVPIICAPLSTDSFSIAAKVEHFKVGATFDIRTASVEEILEVINVVLNDQKFEETVKRASALIKDRPFTPPQIAANAIEHVLKYGSNHMKSPLKDLSFFAYAGGDVWLVVFAISFFIIWLITKLFLKCALRR